MSLYRYNWKNNDKRKLLFGKLCAITARGAKNSVEVEFLDGTREIVSRFALRRFSDLTFANGTPARGVVLDAETTRNDWTPYDPFARDKVEKELKRGK